MIDKNKDALPLVHHKDLKQISDMIDNAVYLYDKGWTKEELKSFSKGVKDVYRNFYKSASPTGKKLFKKVEKHLKRKLL